MIISKSKLKNMVEELPKDVEIDEVMYRLYLLQKIEAGESDIQSRRTLSHDQATEQLAKKWQG
jgi:hypothetical protein